MTIQNDYVIANALVRQALIAAQEVMGENGLVAVLRSAGLEDFVGNFPPDDLEPSISATEYARLNHAIEEFYGRGGRGILKRIGRASFRYGVNEQSTLMGLAGVALKAMPKQRRIKFVLNSIADALKKTNPKMEAWTGEKGGRLIYVVRTCSVCLGRSSDKPICYTYEGSLSEALKWATGDEYQIRETACRAMGDEYCLFEIGNSLS